MQHNASWYASCRGTQRTCVDLEAAVPTSCMAAKLVSCSFFFVRPSRCLETAGRRQFISGSFFRVHESTHGQKALTREKQSVAGSGGVSRNFASIFVSTPIVHLNRVT